MSVVTDHMKNENQIKEDINGRLHSLDQNVRSVEKRLRAVERRLSLNVPPEDSIPEYRIDVEEAIRNTKEEIFTINSEIETLREINSSNADIGDKLSALDSCFAVLNSDIIKLKEENVRLHALLEQNNSPAEPIDIEPLTADIREEISQLGMRLEKAENRNRINIGSVRVPVELSGIVGAFILSVTGLLIMGGRWDIIRSANFSFTIALVFATAVLLKFYAVNNKNI